GGPGQGGPAGSPQIANPVSGPGPTACHCNGQSSPLVQVSARVTNTGARAGSEVAQLYLGDPAVAGEPPRQLKGFKRVTLQPGQSTTVRFTLTGHDLSYWDSSANGWVVPDGSYKVLVGDSSALAGLPLRGSFIVSRSIGARYATVQAPSKAAPDSTFTVKAQFVNGGDYAVNGARFSLDTPPGWKVSSAGPAPHRIAAHQSVNRAFRVTVPESAQGTTAILTAELTFHQPGSGRHGRQVVATTHVTIEPAVTMTATPVSASPGHPGTTTLTFTSNLPGPAQVKVVASPPSGITVNPASTTVTVPPKGTTATLGLTVASTTPGGNYRVVLASSLVNGGHSYPLAPAQVQVTVPYASFAAAYDNTGISTDVATTAGNFDGGGESFSAQALASGTPTALTPGAKVTVGGVSLTWPDVAAGQPDNVIAEGQTIELSGSGTKLALLGSSNNGTGTGTLTVHYSDGTSQPATISVADWYANSAATGESLVTSTSHWNTASGPSGHAVSVYSNVIPLQPNKTVQSITLPDVSSGVGNSVNAMHVFAVGIG
ncbi:MAG: fibronectin type III-like domain-contianing protein, partial [Acidimicrobiales bacterium]